MAEKSKFDTDLAVRVVATLGTFLAIDYLIDGSDTDRFLIGEVAKYAEWVIALGGAAFTWVVSRKWT